VRIALFPSAYAPAVGGVEELTARLAHRLRKAGDETEVWTIRHPAELPAEEPIDGIQVRRFELPLPRLAAGPLARFPWDARAAAQPLLRAGRSFRPDVIHVQCFSANGVYADWLARRLRVPLLVTLQGETIMDDANIYDRSVTLRFALRRALRGAAAVTGCSRYVLADAERRFGLKGGRASVVPNGVELDEATSPERIDIPFETFVFAVGRVVDKKGFDLLLDAFAKVAAAYPEVGLVVGGDGPALERLARSVTRLGLDGRVALPGKLSRRQVRWGMEAARVFVLPSRVEPFGIVVLEALRAGCPAVVSVHGGATEIVRDGIDGLVVDPLDADALARAIHRLLAEPELSSRLRRAGRSRAAAFDWSSVAAQYRELYGRIAA
jgi:glycogen(starch) synthase